MFFDKPWPKKWPFPDPWLVRWENYLYVKHPLAPGEMNLEGEWPTVQLYLGAGIIAAFIVALYGLSRLVDLLRKKDV